MDHEIWFKSQIHHGPHVCFAKASKFSVSSPASSKVMGLILAPSAL